MNPETINEARALLPLAEVRRKCGNCSACCTTLAINETARVVDADGTTTAKVLFEKAPNTRCEHVRQGNTCCGVYEKRPGPCKTFVCGWLQGMGANRDRPDKINVIFAMEETDIGPALILYETRAKASRSSRVRQLAQLIVDKYHNDGNGDLAVIAAGVDWRHILLCPPARQAAVTQAVAAGQTEEGYTLTGQTTAGGQGPNW